MSWVEVESKIRVRDLRTTREAIKKIANFVKVENKIDDYYSLERKRYPKKSLRVRQRGRSVEVNFKQWRNYEEGVWAKKEVEFRVSDLKNFFDLLDNFGFKKWLRKEKRTELYKTKDGVNIELNRVKGLGWFIEIEILCQPQDVAKSREKIEAIVKKLEVGGNYLDKKGYTKSLWTIQRRKKLK